MCERCKFVATRCTELHAISSRAVSVYRTLEVGTLRNFDNPLRPWHIARMIFIGYQRRDRTTARRRSVCHLAFDIKTPYRSQRRTEFERQPRNAVNVARAEQITWNDSIYQC
jgi:hypothetical protein